jgi:hypothetical protein
MAKSFEVLQMLCPNAIYHQIGETYEAINWFNEIPPITKKQYEDGFAQYDAWKAEQDAIKAQAKAALLERLGLTQAEFNTLTA